MACDRKTVVFLLQLIIGCQCRDIVLLDSYRNLTRRGTLDWQTNKTNSRGIGWREASINPNNGRLRRIYSVCDVTVPSVSNWLRLPYVERGPAERLHIQLDFTMRNCLKHNAHQSIVQCKETFQLVYYSAGRNFATPLMPIWSLGQGYYTVIDKIAARHTFSAAVSSGQDAEPLINTVERGVPATLNGVYFAIHETGACTSIQRVQVFYRVCSSTVEKLARFPDSPITSDGVNSANVNGQCVPNSKEIEQPVSMCQPTGVWNFARGSCHCNPGYQPTSAEKSCTACPVGTYKDTTDNAACLPCPAHSQTSTTASTVCPCSPSYYRGGTDAATTDCARPPSAPRNLTTVTFDQTVIKLRWKRPLSTGGRDDLTYHVLCHVCVIARGCEPCDGAVRYNPAESGFQQTEVELSGLEPSHSYLIKVYAKTGINMRLADFHHVEAKVDTAKAISDQLKAVESKASGISGSGTAWITLSWPNPSGKYRQYEVKYRQADADPRNATSKKTNNPSITFNNLKLKTQYTFQTRGQTQLGWGQYSTPLFIWTNPKTTDTTNISKPDGGSDDTNGIITGAVVAVFVCVAIVVIMVIVCYYRKNDKLCNEKHHGDCDTLHYNNVQFAAPIVVETPHPYHGGLTVPLFAPSQSIRTYVDPHTYEDPQQAVREFTKEIDFTNVIIESVIGGGEFGDVCLGKLKVPGKVEITVAIKTLKQGASEKNRLDFLTEASIMGQFDDPNVIYLEGVVIKSEPIMIITEFMDNGSLDTFLRNNDGKLSALQLVGMLRGIAKGMKYLQEMSYVHRDLAARNILVNDNLVCKVSDFGLSREIEGDNTDGAYTTKGGKIPVRWTAPEAITYRKFTSSSDVWSYGVVAWEVMSFGERPYWNWSNQDVIKAVDKGYRLPPPMDCPEAMHQLMLDCWQKERSHRPKFSNIVKTLDKLIRSPDLLRKVAKPRPHNILDPNTADMTRFQSVGEWLMHIKMERYVEDFLRCGCNSMEHVACITLGDLERIGVTLVGHQKKIMNSVQTLKAQLVGAQVQVSEGFLV